MIAFDLSSQGLCTKYDLNRRLFIQDSKLVDALMYKSDQSVFRLNDHTPNTIHTYLFCWHWMQCLINCITSLRMPVQLKRWVIIFRVDLIPWWLRSWYDDITLTHVLGTNNWNFPYSVFRHKKSIEVSPIDMYLACDGGWIDALMYESDQSVSDSTTTPNTIHTFSSWCTNLIEQPQNISDCASLSWWVYRMNNL